jgi:hypothetical protein
MNVDRQGPTATLLTNGQVLVAGGISAISGPQSSSELYDPDTGTWTITGSMHASRYSNHAAVLLPNGQVLVSGGALGGIGPLSSSVLYNPSLGSWSITGSMKVGRGWHTMTLLANGQVLAVGGSGPPSDGGFHALASAELYGSPNVTPIFLSNPVTLPGGAFQFGFTNTHGATFSVLGTSDASMAVSNWTGLGTASEISPGNFQFVDTQATNNPQRFYRVRAP